LAALARSSATPGSLRACLPCRSNAARQNQCNPTAPYHCLSLTLQWYDAVHAA
jgi:hypothetical protein